MAIRQEQLAGGVTLVLVDGRLDQGQNGELEAALNELLADDQIKLVVDLSQTSYINSGGLRCLVTVWRKARQQEGNLVLSGLNPRLQDIFRMVGFDKVFQIFPTNAKAQQVYTLDH